MTDKLDELAAILGVMRAELPPVFHFEKPKVLKVGINEDLLARFPDVDRERLSAWLAMWTSLPDYLKRTAGRHRRNRHDLDNEHAGEISGKAKWWAVQRLRAMAPDGEMPALSATAGAA